MEDNLGFEESTAAYLERENNRFEVLTAANPRDGLECIAEHDIDCVVSDYEMPGAEGIEFLESVSLSEIGTGCWQNADTEEMDLTVEADGRSGPIETGSNSSLRTSIATRPNTAEPG